MSGREKTSKEQLDKEVEIFNNDIELYLREFCDENGIDDPKEITQNVWNAALMYIRKHAFPTTDLLKARRAVELPGLNATRQQETYDIELLDRICDIYIYLCSLSDKESSVMGFSYLTGIDYQEVYTWGSGMYRLSEGYKLIYKKLMNSREESLSAKLATGKQNPVGILAILNRHFSWNLPGVSRERLESRAPRADQLPRLGNEKPPELPEKVDLIYPDSDIEKQTEKQDK